MAYNNMMSKEIIMKWYSSFTQVLDMKKHLSSNQLYIEDPATHWGKTINLARYAVYSQP